MFGFIILSVPVGFVSAESVSIESITPGTTVLAKTYVSFRIVPVGFLGQLYRVSDSFAGSSISNERIDRGGNLYWSPETKDVGTHTFTITASDYEGHSAVVTQTITVAPPPSISIQSVSPGNKIMPGTKFSFVVSATGFTNPTLNVDDSFSGSSAPQVKIDASGNFFWNPEMFDNGEHTINVYAYDTEGHSASASVNVLVGEGPMIKIPFVSPGSSITPGQTLSFTAIPTNFSPSAFSVNDNFSGVTTVSNNNIDTAGVFSWRPSATDVGTHTLTIKGIVGTFGKSAETTQVITVLGPGGIPPSPTVLGANTTTAVPADSSDAAIYALQAKLAELNAKIAVQSGATTAASVPSTSSSGTFNTYLYSGMEGDEVLKLQKVLKQEGYFTAEPNGSFGPITVAAVRKFQAAHGLKQLGVVGPATRSALNTLSIGTVAGASTSAPGAYVFENFIGWGDHGTDVLELQKRLATLGFFSEEPTGYFGSVTESAVRKFQTAHDIDARGHVGPGTRAALNQ